MEQVTLTRESLIMDSFHYFWIGVLLNSTGTVSQSLPVIIDSVRVSFEFRTVKTSVPVDRSIPTRLIVFNRSMDAPRFSSIILVIWNLEFMDLFGMLCQTINMVILRNLPLINLI